MSPHGELPEPDGEVSSSGRTTDGAPAVGVLVELRKPHACGERLWTVTRVGSDVGLCCRGCRRRIVLPRAQFEQRVRGYPEPERSDAE